MDLSWVDPKELRPLRRAEYDRLVAAGVFDDERIELLHGFLVAKEPQGPDHADTTRHIRDLLVTALGDRAVVYDHSPLASSEDSEPEPDIAVVPPGDYRQALPTSALLVVEVAGSSLRKDRAVKAELYAASAIPEYWLIDLAARTLERRTEPDHGRYGTLETLRSGRITLAGFPDISFDVEDILRNR